MPSRGQIALHVGDAGIRVMEDGRRERGVRVAAREDVGEMLEAAGAAEAMTGMFTASATAAVSSQSKPARVPSRSIDVSRISPAPRASASRAHSTASRAASAVPLRTNTAKRPLELPAGRPSLRIDRDDDRLAAVPAGERGDQLRVAQRGGVEADLVRARVNGGGRGVFVDGCRRRR